MVTIKDIAKILASQHDITVSEAENFIQQLVETVNEGLDKDRLVKIKGFGTFKIQAMKPRSSVSVNTGERVVIGEHDKVNFLPEASMKDTINKPFAHFETVEIEDNSPLLKDTSVEDSQEDSQDEEVQEEESAKEEVREKKEQLSTQHSEPKTETRPTEDKPTEDKPTEDKPTEDKPAEDKPAEAKPTEDKPAENKPTEDKPAEAKPAKPEPVKPEPVKAEPAKAEKKVLSTQHSALSTQVKSSPLTVEEDSESISERMHGNANVFVGIAAGILIVIAAIFGFSKYNNKINNVQPPKVQTIVADTVKKDTIKKDTAAIEKTTPVDTVKKDTTTVKKKKSKRRRRYRRHRRYRR